MSKLLAAVLVFAVSACSPKAGTPEAQHADGPFTVSDFFAPSGAMGDGEVPDNLVISENSGCKDRPSGARGSCYAFAYQPVKAPPSGNGAPLFWAGVYWQHPANNWGSDPGLPIVASKVTKVSFQAAVGSGSEMLKFDIGGVADAKFPNHDQFKLEQMQSVTTDWQKFEMTIPTPLDPNTPISTVIGAFAWFANYPPDTNSATAQLKTIYIDDLVYE